LSKKIASFSTSTVASEVYFQKEKEKHCSFAFWKYTSGQKHNFIHVRMYTSEHTCDLLESMEEKKLITRKGKYLCRAKLQKVDKA